MRLMVVVEPEEEGGFSAFVPALPGCVAEGITPAEALCSIRVAIEDYLGLEAEDLVVPEGGEVHEMIV